MASRPLILQDFFPFALSLCAHEVSGLISGAFDRLYGLKIPEWRLVVVLKEDGPSTQQALVKRSRMDKVTISRAAQSLAKRRLITRFAHEFDGRSHHLTLTPEGERLFEAVVPAAMHYERHVLSDLSSDEVNQLKSLLKRVEEAALKVENKV
jgi:DNA-binding MarR family transcriptional regulator